MVFFNSVDSLRGSLLVSRRIVWCPRRWRGALGPPPNPSKSLGGKGMPRPSPRGSMAPRHSDSQADGRHCHVSGPSRFQGATLPWDLRVAVGASPFREQYRYVQVRTEGGEEAHIKASWEIEVLNGRIVEVYVCLFGRIDAIAPMTILILRSWRGR